MDRIAKAEMVWGKYCDVIKKTICVKANHQDFCHDVLQDVFIKVIDHINKVEKVESQGAYLLRLASNAVIDYYRDYNKNAKKLQDAREIGIFSGVIQLETKEAIQLADCCLASLIALLPKKYQEVIILRELKGFSQKQLAEKLNISVSGVKSRLQRGREKLRTIILKRYSYKFDRYGNILSCCTF